ncbi:MAG TPA: autotransporter-associated beta strand repeat-containing protein [Verrucomicrobiae bacterium]|nr:autotransporter-associated beta strand repeat-containing protein [Verrucomicrobiae bacterium]
MTKPQPLLKLLLPVIAVAVISSAMPAGAQSIWSATPGVSANTNWNTAGNWLPSGIPAATTNVLFNDGGGNTVPGTIDNVVNVNTMIQQLVYRETNAFHNTLIAPGVTLTISNSVAITNLMAGTENSASTPSTLMVTNTISGAGGTLAITSSNAGSMIVVREISTTSGSHLSVLDMSGLDTFNASVGNVWVGVYPGTATTARPQGVLYLAKTNVLSLQTVGTKLAPALDVGDTGSSPDSGNVLVLGVNNNIAADTIEVGSQRSGGSLKFNPAFTNITTPSLLLRGHSGTRVTSFNIGDQSSSTASIGSVSTGNVDLSGGTIDAMVGAMTLAWGQPVSGTLAGTATATLTMTAGTLNVNTMDIAIQTNAAVTGAASTGTVNVNGGTLVVNSSLRLGYYSGGGAASKGTLNITNGTVLATNIVAGGGTSGINMSGGLLVVTNTMGTVAAPLSAVSINNGATLQFTPASGVTPAQVVTLSADNSGIINVGSLPVIAAYPSQFPLITYQGGSGNALIFTLGTLPGTFKGYVSNDNTSTIYVVITNGPSLASVVWGGGVNNLWDTNSLNWTNNGAAVKYANLDVVTFNDSGKTNNINVTGTFTNAAWLQNNSALSYTFSGVGSFGGSGGLTMNSNGTVTLAESGGDNFSGGITVNAGTLFLDNANCAISGGLTIASAATVQIGKNDGNGALPVGALDDEGALIFSRSNAVFVNTLIPGAGSLTQSGNGTLYLSVSNSYTGNTTVTGGTLALTNTGSILASPQVTVTGAKLDVSGVSGIVALATLNLNNAGLTMAVGYSQTNLNVSGLNMGGTANTLNIASLPPIASYPITLTVIQSASGISGFNMGVGTLPAGVTGSVSQSGDGTAVLLTLASGPIGVRPTVVWTGGDASVTTNWSDRLNWQQPGAPTAADNVVFNNTAAAGGSDLSSAGGGLAALDPGAINNNVDSNFTIASLTYTNNGGSYHNTAIANGATLTVTNFFTVGAMDSASTLQQVFVNVAGAGGATLNVNNTNSNLQVWEGNTGGAASFAQLDLSALGTFTANVSRLTVGACAINNAVNRPGGILYLAKTNTITTTFQATNVETGSTTGNSGLVLGDCNQNPGPTSFIYLGQVNTISADTIGIARQKANGTVQFNPIYANTAPYPSVMFKGFSSSLVSILDVGDGLGNSGTTAGIGDLNLAGGLVTGAVDTLNVGRASNAGTAISTTTGSLEFDAGTITANTVNLGYQSATGTKAGAGTISVNTNATIGAGANLVVNGTMSLSVNANNATTAGTLNINGGSVQAATIVAGTNGAVSTINLNAGTLGVTGTAGSTFAPLTTLNLADATTLQLAVNGPANATNIVATSVNVGGTTMLQITALAGVATNIAYPLINYTGSDPYTGLSLASLPAGYAGTLVDSTGSNNVSLLLTVVPPPPTPAHFTGISVNGTTLNISATNGVHNGTYVLLGTTNLVKPLSQWTRLLTNSFNGSGNLNLSTNIINPAVPQQFYIISQ